MRLLKALNIKMLRCFSTKFTPQQLQGLATRLPTWTVNSVNHSIHKQFLFKDFKQAWQFMQLVAGVADAKDHHPEWFNVYNRVEVTLRTHDASGVTEKDEDLASFMDKAEETVSLT
jgi:4a-hydroxytetrahydrobiopterin dehydratase